MNFVIHSSFPAFVKALKHGNTVYSLPYSQAKGGSGEYQAIIMLTSDAGTEGGTIHALRVAVDVVDEIDTEGDKALTLAIGTSEKVESFLKAKGLIVRDGILLTAGLQDALRFWGNAPAYDVKLLEEVLTEGQKVNLE